MKYLQLSYSLRGSWLIDHDKDVEGMQVIADLHGGDPEDLVARAEFQEIKERVLLDVNSLLHYFWSSCPNCYCSAREW
jgi:hypothetical protein